jgi:hypothetical protein
MTERKSWTRAKNTHTIPANIASGHKYLCNFSHIRPELFDSESSVSDFRPCAFICIEVEDCLRWVVIRDSMMSVIPDDLA